MWVQWQVVPMLSLATSEPWWNVIPEGVRLVFASVLFLTGLLVLSIVLYFAELSVVRGRKVRRVYAFIISLLGTAASSAFFLLSPHSLVALFLSGLVWLLLIKRLYRTRWFGALAVAIMTLMVFLVIVVFLALVFGILVEILERFFSFVLLV
jgi:hypothetical protein